MSSQDLNEDKIFQYIEQYLMNSVTSEEWQPFLDELSQISRGSAIPYPMELEQIKTTTDDSMNIDDFTNCYVSLTRCPVEEYMSIPSLNDIQSEINQHHEEREMASQSSELQLRDAATQTEVDDTFYQNA